MKIVIAPDSFKESLSALEVANEIEAGFKLRLPDAEYLKVPVADGGEGTVQSMVDATNGHLVELEVCGPLGQAVKAHYGILGTEGGNHGARTAVIEMAAASGLHHVSPALRNPRLTTSYGTGELIVDAMERGIRHFIIGLGGSATNDGGAGMAKALGAKLLDSTGLEISPGGAALAALATLDCSQLHPALNDCHFEVACDVDNPLCGERGASAVFGPQKGATEEMVTELDAALGHFADILVQSGFEDKRLQSGAGAAGGMGLGVMAFLDAELRPGIDIVMQAVGLDAKLEGAALVITGEGRIDGQTIYGKTPMGVLRLAKARNIPVIGIAGCLGAGSELVLEQGMSAIFDIIPSACDLSKALAEARANLQRTSSNIAALLALQLNNAN
ncbi:glycerate kinase [Shewanella algae]|uniref:glycerate kinase n=1 Tax=Shewanella algae TaxID=38313 RepID=UPI00118387BB|nr:glycerate kinase [Shewanella algae]TVL50340.1 glycerate kinase [Shewanella algae]